MRWTNKGHEFDDMYAEYSKIFSCSKKVYVFGAGKKGKFYGNILHYFNILEGYIDNYKSSEVCCGYKINSLKEYKKDRTVIVCVSDKYIPEISRQLIEMGLKEKRDFWYCEDFFSDILPITLLYERNVLFIKMIQLSLTERCTLKCKKCAHACNYVPINSKDISLTDIKYSIDSFFGSVDFTYYFLIIGGEPLLSKNLVPTIEYIGEKYRNRIGKLQITTNGTIIPTDDLLRTCKSNNVNFNVSNYSKAVPQIKERLNRFKERMESNHIEYSIVPEEHEWTDYGFDFVDREYENLQNVFDSCKTECHEIRGNRLYFCIMARSVSENMMKNIGAEDYFNLLKKECDIEEYKKQLFEYIMGYSDKGYLDMCNYCNGNDRFNWPILAAEQERIE